MAHYSLQRPPSLAWGGDDLIARLPPVRGKLRPNADLSKVNWFQVGGPAEVLFRPEDEQDLADFIRHKPKNIPVTVLGVGSNLLVRDGGVEGVAIRLGRAFVEVGADGDRIHAGAGALSLHAAQMAQSASLAGLEFLSGIPGTVGGAACMNAGAYGKETKDVLVSARLVDDTGNLRSVSVEEIGYVYRGNHLPPGCIFTHSTFQAQAGEAQAIAAEMNRIARERGASQPIKSRTGGSTFKNPPGHKAWELIDAAGCRGLKMGAAQVSELHCNFLINLGGATAAEIERLGEEVRARVKAHSGIALEWEIKRIGKTM